MARTLALDMALGSRPVSRYLADDCRGRAVESAVNHPRIWKRRFHRFIPWEQKYIVQLFTRVICSKQRTSNCDIALRMYNTKYGSHYVYGGIRKNRIAKLWLCGAHESPIFKSCTFSVREFERCMRVKHAVRQRYIHTMQHSRAYFKLHVTRSLLVGSSRRNCNIGLHKAGMELGGSMPKLVRDASKLRGGRRIFSGDIRAAQTRYIARGCPLLDVIGRSLTSTVDGKFIGRLLP